MRGKKGNNEITHYLQRKRYIQFVPRKGFGSADCVQRDRITVNVVSQAADISPFRGTAGRILVFFQATNSFCFQGETCIFFFVHFFPYVFLDKAIS